MVYGLVFVITFVQQLYMRVLLIVSALTVTACATTKPKVAAVPTCIEEKIEVLKKQAKQNPPASVEQYTYHGKEVYLFSAPCCDFFNELVDENCNRVCAPSGGITGKGDGKCPDFKTAATFGKVVWKDDR
jgi:hypothetical protein